jgi:hypothetical protein
MGVQDFQDSIRIFKDWVEIRKMGVQDSVRDSGISGISGIGEGACLSIRTLL